MDDTLYPSGNGLWDAIRSRMSQYMLERVGIPADQIPELRRSYYTDYGTTLRGLQIHYGVDAEEYLDYVHDLPLERYLKPVPVLRLMLNSLPQKRWIFTNADATYAGKVLTHLQLQDIFSGIIDIRATGFVCKPDPQAYRRALELADNPPPEGCLLIDDSTANLAPARRLGMTTVWINPSGERHVAATLTIPHLLQLPRVLPGLWS